jgi:exodeoxyribonuclease VII large subunit
MAWERSSAALAALGPQATLDRGYAIVRRGADGAVVREPAEAPAGELLAITVARGELAGALSRKSPGPREAVIEELVAGRRC